MFLHKYQVNIFIHVARQQIYLLSYFEEKKRLEMVPYLCIYLFIANGILRCKIMKASKYILCYLLMTHTIQNIIMMSRPIHASQILQKTLFERFKFMVILKFQNMKKGKMQTFLMLYEMACQAAWDRRIVYFKITRGKVDFLYLREET